MTGSNALLIDPKLREDYELRNLDAADLQSLCGYAGQVFGMIAQELTDGQAFRGQDGHYNLIAVANLCGRAMRAVQEEEADRVSRFFDQLQPQFRKERQ